MWVYGKLQCSTDDNCAISIEPSAALKSFIDGSITINWMVTRAAGWRAYHMFFLSSPLINIVPMVMDLHRFTHQETSTI
jgi:hypothetical protein